mmetsp:Transcript_18449/g.30901  ORF Transcript_18449/g.30901 Transcript_18449/m.30901 type:complete len:312 (+) Transcript_18449:1377-2312(+)
MEEEEEVLMAVDVVVLGRFFFPFAATDSFMETPLSAAVVAASAWVPVTPVALAAAAAAAAAAAGGGVTSDASSISAEESGYHYSVGNNNENNGNNAFTAAANTTNTLVNSNESGQYSTGSGVGGDAELDMNIIHLLETFDWNGTGSRAQSPYTDRTDNESSTASSYTSAIAVTYGATTIPPGGAESSATTNAHKKMCGGGADVSTSDYNNYSDSYSTHQYIQADGSLHSPLGGRSCGGMSGVTSYTNSAMSSALPSAVPSYSQLCSLVGPSSPNGVNAAAAESQPPPPPPAAAAAKAITATVCTCDRSKEQ